MRVVRWQPVGERHPGDPRRLGHRRHTARPDACRVRVLVDGGGKLFVTTGDSADGRARRIWTISEARSSRVNRDGTIPSDNPYAASVTRKRRYVWNWGHRNPRAWRDAARDRPDVQRRARSGSRRRGESGSAETELRLGPGVCRRQSWIQPERPDDESGEISNAIPAVWSSGFPTLAPSGIEFTSGRKWGTYGALLMALLKDTGVLALTLDAAGNVVATAQVPELNDTYGRIPHDPPGSGRFALCPDLQRRRHRRRSAGDPA